MEQNEIVLEELEQVSGGAATKYVVYVVKKGDTLGKLAKKYGTTVNAIYEANKDLIKDKNLIKVGWKLLIPTK